VITAALVADSCPASAEQIGRVRPKIMTASTASLGLLPLLVLRLHGPRSNDRSRS